VFFGSPEFAVPSLRALLGEGFDVAGVVTQPDKSQGRSRSALIPPPVKQVAAAEDLAVLQPERPVGAEFLDALKALDPELGVVVAYGHILKPALLAIPRLGMINVHASLLPKLRGAAPIQHALIEGLVETGVSIMQIEEGLDTGPVLLRVATPVAPDETAGELTTRLAEMGALALVEALEMMESGVVEPEAQDHAGATYAPKITRELAHIPWDAPAEQVARLVRALDAKPGAWTTLEGREVKLFGPTERQGNGGAPAPGPAPAPGTVLATDPALLVMTGSGALEFADVQPSGATRMPAGAWIRGRGVRAGQRFG